jgi:hypothetical protein
MKLTKNQQELLDAMKAGAICHYMRYAGRFNPTAYYFRSDTMMRCTKTAEALLARGLVAIEKKNNFGDHNLVYVDRQLAEGK